MGNLIDSANSKSFRYASRRKSCRFSPSMFLFWHFIFCISWLAAFWIFKYKNIIIKNINNTSVVQILYDQGIRETTIDRDRKIELFQLQNISWIHHSLFRSIENKFSQDNWQSFLLAIRFPGWKGIEILNFSFSTLLKNKSRNVDKTRIWTISQKQIEFNV